MKRLLVRLATGYAGLGALAYLVHRTRYLTTVPLRDWTDHRSQALTQELQHLQSELQTVRRQLRLVNQKPPLISSGGHLPAFPARAA